MRVLHIYIDKTQVLIKNINIEISDECLTTAIISSQKFHQKLSSSRFHNVVIKLII